MGNGVNVSKANAYAVVTPPSGAAVAKANAYAVIVPPAGASVAKAVAYAVIVETDPPVTNARPLILCCT